VQPADRESKVDKPYRPCSGNMPEPRSVSVVAAVATMYAESLVRLSHLRRPEDLVAREAPAVLMAQVDRAARMDQEQLSDL
jgi:hypothetical protein